MLILFRILFILPVLAFSEPMKIAVISDLNSSYLDLRYTDSAKDVIQYLKKEDDLDAILITGDMIPGQVTQEIRNKYPGRKSVTIKQLWRSFRENIYKPLKKMGVPILITPGNHDAGFGKLIEDERQIYKEMWRDYFKKQPYGNYIFPPELAYKKNNFTYAFQIKGLTFLSLDATRSIISEEQTAFIMKLLAKTLPNKLIAFGHLPFFPFSQQKKGRWEYLHSLELYHLFKKFRIPYFSGHTHVYFPGKVITDSKQGYRKRNWYNISVGCLGTGQRYVNKGEAKQLPSFLIVEFDTDQIQETLQVQAQAYENNSFIPYDDNKIKSYIIRNSKKILNFNHKDNN